GRALAGLRHDSNVHEVELWPFDLTETTALAAEVAGRPLVGAAVQELYRESDGNALYVVEAMRAGEQLALPATLHMVIAERLAPLTPAARELAGLAATAGRGFSLELLLHA